MSERKEIRVKTNSTLDIQYSDFASIRAEMDVIEKANPSLSKFFISMEAYAYSDGQEYAQVYGVRAETDDEMADREVIERRNREAQEERERAEFERLTKKFWA